MDQKVIEHDFQTAKAIKYSQMYQLTPTRRIGSDDRLDSLAMDVAFWVKQMARDNDKAAKSIRGLQLIQP